MFGTMAATRAVAPTLPLSGASARAADAFQLDDDYSADAADTLAAVLECLVEHGYGRASLNELSAFERVLGGLCWLLQRIVPREDAAHRRVDWDLLFQPHNKMKPRLELAQAVLKCVEALPTACPVPIQPHQLLLQDFGDIGTVKKLVAWLVAQGERATHSDKIQSHRAYLDVQQRGKTSAGDADSVKPLKREVAYLQGVYRPRRRWQYMSSSSLDEPEDALIQRCLLEYGERVCAVREPPREQANPDELGHGGTDESNDACVSTAERSGDVHKQLLSQLATQAASFSNKAARRQNAGAPTASLKKSLSQAKWSEFEAQYQKLERQAMEEQAKMMEKQREREQQLLQQVVSVQEIHNIEPVNVMPNNGAHRNGKEQKVPVVPIESVEMELVSKEIESARAKLNKCNRQLQAIEQEQETVHAQLVLKEAEESAAEQAIAQAEFQLQQMDIVEAKHQEAKPQLSKLKELVQRNELLKRQKNEFKLKCREQLTTLQARVEQLRLQAEQDAAKQDEETLRLNEVEQLHTQMALKHKEMKQALAQQTRDIHKMSKKIDDVPTRIELIQYEKRFLELYEEVALTLDETRKYYCVYNTLKTTHEFLEKEISLINSIHDNFDVAMSSKAATQAFFTQIDAIMTNVRGTIAKQQTLRADNQRQVETLDSKYQLLLEKERMYVNAIREFQRECEKNEKLSLKLQQVAP
ncbi:TPA: hypothetical protein N0F65_010793 [Lagenidium giganteum]|uniref:CCDC93 coiled-coil domain-containing protein n=1 Tax=Lagenidium giganteum TaxID=4803 RepID=A0AAV2YJ28_9STRA|nr:TPA: hypothetical protein N0F65_010793 [Lagenidium giganteum]